MAAIRLRLPCRGMRLYIADETAPKSLDELSALGLEVVYDPKCSAEELPARIGDAGILVVRSTKVTRATIEAGAAARAHRARGRRVRHHRRRGGQRAGHLRQQLPGQEQRRGRRARDGPHPRARPPPRRRDQRPARGHVEQEGVRQGRRPQGQDARPRGSRAHRRARWRGAPARSRCTSSRGRSRSTRRSATAHGVERLRDAARARGALGRRLASTCRRPWRRSGSSTRTSSPG